jgi:hypothetical protein
MAIDSAHPLHTARLPQWLRCRHCHDGADAVKAAGTTYLPMLSGQDSGRYDAYRQRAMFYNAFARTVQALTGVLFRRPAPPTGPSSLATEWLDVTRAGQSLDLFAMSVADELFKVGRAGVLLDAPERGDPYWVTYRAEDVLSWQAQRGADGVPVASRVVLREPLAMQDPKDQYVVVITHQLRELYLAAGGPSPVYEQQLWRHPVREDGVVDASKWERSGPPVRPLRRGAVMSFVPFVFLNATSLLAEPGRPPLLDLADVNLSHYRTSADLEHGRHFTALPTPWITGYDGRSGTLTIGSEEAWAVANEKAQVGMLEFTGAGLASLERAMDQKERQMAVLGARLLEQQKAGVEAEGTLRMRHAGDDATLRLVAATLSAGMSRAMRWHAWWLGAANAPDVRDIGYDLGVEFFSVRMSSGDLQALVQAYQAGTMSFETLYFNLQRGDVARPDVDAKAERHAIDAEDEPPPDADADADADADPDPDAGDGDGEGDDAAAGDGEADDDDAAGDDAAVPPKRTPPPPPRRR